MRWRCATREYRLVDRCEESDTQLMNRKAADLSLTCWIKAKVHELRMIEAGTYGTATALGCRMLEPARLGYGWLYFDEM